MDKFYKIITTYFVLILMLPTLILLTKLSHYLYVVEFKEWWVTILWSLVLPTITLLIFVNKKND